MHSLTHICIFIMYNVHYNDYICVCTYKVNLLNYVSLIYEHMGGPIVSGIENLCCIYEYHVLIIV